jgi:hypothetical protein
MEGVIEMTKAVCYQCNTSYLSAENPDHPDPCPSCGSGSVFLEIPDLNDQPMSAQQRAALLDLAGREDCGPSDIIGAVLMDQPRPWHTITQAQAREVIWKYTAHLGGRECAELVD